MTCSRTPAGNANNPEKLRDYGILLALLEALPYLDTEFNKLRDDRFELNSRQFIRQNNAYRCRGTLPPLEQTPLGTK
ncbi:unnamed protein product [Arctia plantaginis]|uniref:Uncharacterized protein n=1 Tax=Arctia plantaginis TaxID=874455 RepID=A0A8S1AYK8_ARCPL|nr:unnamed protein product [Arctia plantaginis]